MVKGGDETLAKKPKAFADTRVAYLTWLLSGCGVLGGQHFYLGDDRKAFLYLTSLGGFGLAAVRDLWCLPSYCRDAPETNPRRKSFFLLFGAFAFSYYYAKLFAAAYLGFADANLKGDYWHMPIVLRALGATLGSHLVVNSGNRSCGAKAWSIFALALAIQYLIILLPGHVDLDGLDKRFPSPLTLASLGAATLAYRFRNYGGRPRGSKTNKVIRITRLAVCLWAFLVLAAFVFIYNAQISVENTNGQGKTVETTYLRDVDLDQLSWSDVQGYFFLSLLQMDEIARFQDDSVEISEAYEKLGLPDESSMQDVKKRFRKLARELHPDKQPAEKKVEVEKEFSDMQAAYQLLIDKFGRMAKSTEEEADKDEL